MFHPHNSHSTAPPDLLTAAVVAALACAGTSQSQFRVEPIALPNPFTSIGAVAGDIDADGDLDLLLHAQVGNATLLLGNGAGGFQDATSTHLPQGFSYCSGGEFADLDNDGDLDAFAVVERANRGKVFINTGGGIFDQGTTLISFAHVHSFALGDVDGDGDVDIIAMRGGNNSDRDYLLRNDGSATFTPTQLNLSGQQRVTTRDVVLGDIDGDGDLDMIEGVYRYSLGGSYGYNVYVYGSRNLLHLNDGSGQFTNAPMTSSPYFTLDLELGDVDRDGDLDLYAGNADANGIDHPNELYLNDGFGQFYNATATHLPPPTSQSGLLAQLIDLDNDGDLDLLSADLLVNDGNGVFLPQNHRLPNLPPHGVFGIGDIDGDGDVDLLGRSRPNYYTYINLRRQMSTTTPTRIGQVVTFQLETRYGPPALVAPFVSSAAVSMPIQGLGTLGIDPAQAVSLPWQTTTGVASVSFTVPNDPALVGLEMFSQALFLEGSSAHLGNVTTNVIGQ